LSLALVGLSEALFEESIDEFVIGVAALFIELVQAYTPARLNSPASNRGNLLIGYTFFILALTLPLFSRYYYSRAAIKSRAVGSQTNPGG